MSSEETKEEWKKFLSGKKNIFRKADQESDKVLTW